LLHVWFTTEGGGDFLEPCFFSTIFISNSQTPLSSQVNVREFQTIHGIAQSLAGFDSDVEHRRIEELNNARPNLLLDFQTEAIARVES
jgi:hypothetical protein